MQPTAWNAKLTHSYDRIAELYAERYHDELDRKPFDRALLDRFALAVRRRGSVGDIGCGPGHIAAYLARRGVDVFGMDLSERMVTVATRLNPTIPFLRGDLLALDLPAGSLAGLVAMYAIIHLRRNMAPLAAKEAYRVLQPGGRLLISVHGGRGQVHADHWFEQHVSMDATLFQPDEIAHYAERAGLVVDELRVRDPYRFELQHPRIYLLASRPTTA